ncbi:hypothetical protein D3C87_1750490 [compost metagenome]
MVADILLCRTRRKLRLQDSPNHDINQVETSKEQSGQERSCVHAHNRYPGCRCIDDQQDRGRDQNSQSATGTDDAGSVSHIVFRLEHGR